MLSRALFSFWDREFWWSRLLFEEVREDEDGDEERYAVELYVGDLSS